MVVHQVRKPRVFRTGGSRVLAGIGKHGSVALAAAEGGDEELLTWRRAGRYLYVPGAGGGDSRQTVEVGDEMGHVRIADLRLDVGRHDAPRRADRMAELLDTQSAPCQVGAESTLALWPMTVLAAQRVAGP